MREKLPELTEQLRQWLEGLGGKGKARSQVVRRQDLPTYLSGLPRTDRIALVLQSLSQSAGDPQEIQRIKSALPFFKADSYQEWIDVGMMLHAFQLVGEGGSDYGLELWDEWSQTDEKYRKPQGGLAGRDKLEYHWKGFTIKPDGLGPGTFYFRAKERGWKDPPTPFSFRIDDVTSHESGTRQDYAANGHSFAFEAEPDSIVFDANLVESPAPRRKWFGGTWLPDESLTLLFGDGGVGKSTLALQLAFAAVSDTPWLNMPVKQCDVLYVTTEDNRDEIHWRMQEVHKHLTTDHAQRARLHFMDYTLLDDPVMVLFDKNNGMHKQACYTRVEKFIHDHAIGCLILDASANIFGGNEIDRRQVSGFLSSWKAVAERLRLAVILLAHPSVSGMKDDRGYSGSTAWNNIPRARLWFKKYEINLDQPETDLRVLELRKTNRAEPDAKIILRWTDGRFVSTSADTSQSDASKQQELAVFLELLAQLTQQGRTVNHKSGPTYAPAIMMKMPKGRALGKKSLERAMEYAFEQGRVTVRQYGKKTQPHEKIVLNNGSSNYTNNAV